MTVGPPNTNDTPLEMRPRYASPFVRVCFPPDGQPTVITSSGERAPRNSVQPNSQSHRSTPMPPEYLTPTSRSKPLRPEPAGSSGKGSPYPEGSVSTGASEAERLPPVSVWGIPGGPRPGLRGDLCYAGAPSPTHSTHGTQTSQRPSLQVVRGAAGRPHPKH
nr:PREDICTED: WAS/WASL-interacting protein family member 1-like [Bemisia tabaci]